MNPAPIIAQSSAYPYDVEPGVTTIRKPHGTAQMQGQVTIDLRTGDIYGFPTLSVRSIENAPSVIREYSRLTP